MANGSALVDSQILRNGDTGADISPYSSVLNSVIYGNLGSGLNAASGVAIGNNVFSQNTGGNLIGGVQVSGNVCGTVACP